LRSLSGQLSARTIMGSRLSPQRQETKSIFHLKTLALAPRRTLSLCFSVFARWHAFVHAPLRAPMDVILFCESAFFPFNGSRHSLTIARAPQSALAPPQTSLPQFVFNYILLYRLSINLTAGVFGAKCKKEARALGNCE